MPPSLLDIRAFGANFSPSVRTLQKRLATPLHKHAFEHVMICMYIRNVSQIMGKTSYNNSSCDFFFQSKIISVIILQLSRQVHFLLNV